MDSLLGDYTLTSTSFFLFFFGKFEIHKFKDTQSCPYFLSKTMKIGTFKIKDSNGT